MVDKLDNLVYVQPCLSCGSKDYSFPIFENNEGPFCNQNCREKYLDKKADEFIKKHFDYSSIEFR